MSHSAPTIEWPWEMDDCMLEADIEIERVAGDSIAEIKEYWGEASIDEIHQRIMQWKQQPA